jgi:hypothetical protein
MATSKVSLSELIRQLKGEIVAAQNSGDEEMFSLEDVSITTKFVVEASGKAGGKLDLWVVTVDADIASKGQVSHELTVKLSPIKPVYMGKQKEG